MRITAQEYRNDPRLRLSMEIAARRERAQALGRLFSNLLSRTKANHAPGTHLTRQG
jgi:hypothetical protein